jgi:hypothetical protein
VVLPHLFPLNQLTILCRSIHLGFSQTKATETKVKRLVASQLLGR